MFDLTIQGDEAVSIDLQERPVKVTKAMTRALNRAIASARTVVVREMAGDTGLKSKDIRDALVMREAWANGENNSIQASLSASKKRLPLIKFGAKGPEPSRGKGNGVTYRLGGSRNRLATAFIATMKSGHRGVFERSPGKFMKRLSKTGKQIQAIHEKKGPSIGHVFAKFRAAGLAQAHDAFAKNFKHELNFATSGAGGSSAGAE